MSTVSIVLAKRSRSYDHAFDEYAPPFTYARLCVFTSCGKSDLCQRIVRELNLADKLQDLRFRFAKTAHVRRVRNNVTYKDQWAILLPMAYDSAAVWRRCQQAAAKFIRAEDLAMYPDPHVMLGVCDSKQEATDFAELYASECKKRTYALYCRGVFTQDKWADMHSTAPFMTVPEDPVPPDYPWPTKPPFAEPVLGCLRSPTEASTHYEQKVLEEKKRCTKTTQGTEEEKNIDTVIATVGRQVQQTEKAVASPATGRTPLFPETTSDEHQVVRTFRPEIQQTTNTVATPAIEMAPRVHERKSNFSPGRDETPVPTEEEERDAATGLWMLVGRLLAPSGESATLFEAHP